MGIEISDYVDVEGKLINLGCLSPNGGFSLLPVNFEAAVSAADFLQASETATIKKLLLVEGLPIFDVLERGKRPPYIKNKSHDWAAPILFVSTAIYSQNQAFVSVALSVLANYATDFFKGERGRHDVRLDIVVEREKSMTCKKISYCGPIEGLATLPEIIREARNE